MNTTTTTKQRSRFGGFDRAFAGKYAMRLFFAAVVILAMTYVGTRAFTHIDLNLYGYMVGTFVFLGGLFYRFLSWSERPPAQVFIKKGMKLLFRRRGGMETAVESVDNLGMFRFIWNRGPYRWIQHMLMGWGCIIACFVTFPLVFGWMYFTMEDNGMYTVVFMGIDLMRIAAEGFVAYLFYNALNISAAMVIAGASMALYRRLKNMQARAEQTFLFDFLPLYMLLFVSITGLLLTVSNFLLHGWGHAQMSLVHQWSVIVTLIYLPFGKLAHIPMRPLGVLVKQYKAHYAEQAMKDCKTCGTAFISVEQSNDVIDVLRQNAISFESPEGFISPSYARRAAGNTGSRNSAERRRTAFP